MDLDRYKNIEPGSEEEEFARQRGQFLGLEFDLETENRQRGFCRYMAFDKTAMNARDGIVTTPAVPQTRPASTGKPRLQLVRK